MTSRSTSHRRVAIAACLVAVTSIAWLDRHQAVRDANRLYAEGKYEDAAAAYNAALVDKPDSDDLHFNLGDATYKQGKYDEAVASFQKVETAADPKRASRVAYNVGNTTYRRGQALEQTDPQKALGLYAEALASYRRALGLAPDDEDTKFNHELVSKHIEDLKKRLEEQKKDQEQQQDQQKEQQQNQDQQNQEQQQQQGEQEKKEEEQKAPPQDGEQPPQPDAPQEDQQAGDGQQQPPEAEKKDEGQNGEPPTGQQNDAQQPGEQPNEQAGEAVAGGEQKEGELSKGEAAAILDSQRGEEVSPEDVIKKLQGARVAEPAEDW